MGLMPSLLCICVALHGGAVKEHMKAVLAANMKLKQQYASLEQRLDYQKFEEEHHSRKPRKRLRLNRRFRKPKKQQRHADEAKLSRFNMNASIFRTECTKAKMAENYRWVRRMEVSGGCICQRGPCMQNCHPTPLCDMRHEHKQLNMTDPYGKPNAYVVMLIGHDPKVAAAAVYDAGDDGDEAERQHATVDMILALQQSLRHAGALRRAALEVLVVGEVAEAVMQRLEAHGLKLTLRTPLPLPPCIVAPADAQADTDAHVHYTHTAPGWQKVLALTLTHLHRAVLLDADMLVMRNIDHLFDLPATPAFVAADYLFPRDPAAMHYDRPTRSFVAHHHAGPGGAGGGGRGAREEDEEAEDGGGKKGRGAGEGAVAAEGDLRRGAVPFATSLQVLQPNALTYKMVTKALDSCRAHLLSSLGERGFLTNFLRAWYELPGSYNTPAHTAALPGPRRRGRSLARPGPHVVHFAGAFEREKPALANMSALALRAKAAVAAEEAGEAAGRRQANDGDVDRELFIIYCRWHLCMAEVEVKMDADARQKEKSISHAVACLDVVDPRDREFRCR